MEEIDLKELLEFFKKKIMLLVVIAIGVTLGGSLYALLFQKPLYNSYTSIILSGVENQITQNDLSLNKSLVSTYAQIVKSRKVLSQVIDELNLDCTYEELSRKVSVTAVTNTDIINISVVDADGVAAKNIANVTAKVFTEEVINYYNINNVKILDEAIVAKKPYNINIMKQLFIYIVIGGVLGCGVLFMLFYFDRTIKSVEQVEDKVKLPILGSVQLDNKGGK